MEKDIKKRLESLVYKKLESERLSLESSRLCAIKRKISEFENKDAAKKLCLLVRKLEKYASIHMSECSETEALISSIPDPQAKKLFTLRYIEGRKWDEIAHELNYDVDAKGVYKIHAKQLKRLSETEKTG